MLTEERIARLNAIGMQWDAHSVRWEQNYLEALRYYREHGDLNVPVGYKTDSGFNLGAWIQNLRQAKMGRTRQRPLTREQIARLDAIGMQWDNSFENNWERAYREAENYYRQYGSLQVPAAYISPSGLALGKWVRRQKYALQDTKRADASTTNERITMLKRLGIDWGTSASGRT